MSPPETLTTPVVAGSENGATYAVHLDVTTPLKYRNVPMDPEIDFGRLVREAGLPGKLDPNSIEVRSRKTGRFVPHALSDEFANADRGRLLWVISHPQETAYEIRFRTSTKRRQLLGRSHVPPIGVGDLLRYNAGTGRPITLFYSMGLHDLNGDGVADLVGTWNYARRPGRPWSGVVCYPGIGGKKPLRFDDLRRLRVVDRGSGAGDTFLQTAIYVSADVADFNGDGRLDLVVTRSTDNTATFYLNTGRRDAARLPLFATDMTVSTNGKWQACRALDLNNDGALDLVVDGHYIRNKNPNGWPFEAAQPVPLDAGRQPCFLDLDADGRLDAVCLRGGPTVQPDFHRLAWRRNLDGNPPRFGEMQPLDDITLPRITAVASVFGKQRPALLVQHHAFQQISLFQLTKHDARKPRFRLAGRAESVSAVMSLSDQAWPWPCDWDGDGDLDLLVGGGYGWPRIVMNDGDRQRPAFAEPRLILAEGQPIRFLRNQILGKPHHTHDMGYPYPMFADWDGDQLPDLICPNETNRIFWYRNIGTRGVAKFGPRRQILVDGFPDGPEARGQSAERALKATYPREQGRPFFWRTGAAIADLDGDNLPDLVTLDGSTRRATLFTQYNDGSGKRQLRKQRPLKLTDGRFIDDRIVARKAHWTESFRAVDWDQDGLMDLIYSLAGAHGGIQDGGSIFLLRNAGSRTNPVFESPRTLCCYGEPIRVTNHGPHPGVGDFDGDGKPDLIACVEWSVYPFYRHAALVMKRRPTITLGRVRILSTKRQHAVLDR